MNSQIFICLNLSGTNPYRAFLAAIGERTSFLPQKMSPKSGIYFQWRKLPVNRMINLQCPLWDRTYLFYMLRKTQKQHGAFYKFCWSQLKWHRDLLSNITFTLFVYPWMYFECFVHRYRYPLVNHRSCQPELQWAIILISCSREVQRLWSLWSLWSLVQIHSPPRTDAKIWNWEAIARWVRQNNTRVTR